MNGHVPAAQVGIVHEVVVKQRIVVISFQCASHRQHRLGIVFVEIVGEQQERRPYPLPSEREHILDGLVEALRFPFVSDMCKIIVDECQYII